MSKKQRELVKKIRWLGYSKNIAEKISLRAVSPVKLVDMDDQELDNLCEAISAGAE